MNQELVVRILHIPQLVLQNSVSEFPRVNKAMSEFPGICFTLFWYVGNPTHAPHPYSGGGGGVWKEFQFFLWEKKL